MCRDLKPTGCVSHKIRVGTCYRNRTLCEPA